MFQASEMFSPAQIAALIAAERSAKMLRRGAGDHTGASAVHGHPAGIPARAGSSARRRDRELRKGRRPSCAGD